MTLDELKQALIARVVLPPEQGPAGKDGYSIVGAAGKDGKDGLSIVGPKGDKGDPGPEGPPGRDGKDGQSVEKAKAHPLPWDQQPTADFFPETGLLDLGIPKGKPGERGPVGMSARGTFFGGSGSGSGEHPNLAAHDTLGLATDAELASAIAAAIAVHAATPHGSDVPAEFGFTA